MINIAALGLYMLLTTATGNPGSVAAPNMSETPPILVEQKKESVNEANKGVEARVREYFSDTPVLAEVARCESQFRQTGKDGKVLRGRVVAADVGVMQINETYHLAEAKALGMDIHTLDGNLAFGKYLYDKNGTKDWLASRNCWSGSGNLTIKNLPSTAISNS